MPVEENALEEYSSVIAMLPDMVFVLTESGRYAAILGGESSAYYHNGSSLKGLTLFDVLPQDKAVWFLDRIAETLLNNTLMVFDYSLSANEVSGVDEASGPTGLLRFEGRVNPLNSLRYGERAVVWVARNITQRYELEQQLLQQSQTDDLSGAFNRRKLFQYLNEAFYSFQRYQENICFLLIDIDNFKSINDQFGHHVGDEVIRNMVSQCQAELRQSDILGRLGGDEFGVIHKCSSPSSSMALAERLKQAVLGLSVKADDLDLVLSISIGISHFSHNDVALESVYQRADEALYVSKRQGKNCITSR